MVPCHSCHRSKEVGKDLKSSFEVTMQAIRTDNFYGEKGFSLCNTAVLKFYCQSFWVL